MGGIGGRVILGLAVSAKEWQETEYKLRHTDKSVPIRMSVALIAVILLQGFNLWSFDIGNWSLFAFIIYSLIMILPHKKVGKILSEWKKIRKK